ncbi:MAG: response regulator [Selenomonadales bacterium]|nr:response regulator [Selenomonadales bacterium]
MKVLIVDDNENNMTLLRDLLRFHGFDTIEAKDGAEGIAMAKAHRPDLILLDIQMPGMDGVTALRTLKAAVETARIKIVALTSSAMRGDKEKFLAEGADYYISKPIDTRELPQLLKQLMG